MRHIVVFFSDAIRNVESSFAVVGVLEEMEKSLAVLEHYLPRFFNGVTEVYANRDEWGQNVNKNIYQPKVQEYVKQLVRTNITREVEFYQYCKQRLHRQWMALGKE